MVFYLKANRTDEYALKCLQNWFDAISVNADEHKVYFLCDGDQVRKKYLENLALEGINYELLSSDRESEELVHIVTNVTSDRWRNTGFAHLTTFLHAREHGIFEFWNIDADDTLVCLPPERFAKMLETAEVYGRENGLKGFSLDMWRSRSNGWHWSFGVTYTTDPAAWLDVFRGHCEDEQYRTRATVDQYTAYIKREHAGEDFPLETFYFENLKFLHPSSDWTAGTPWEVEMFHWKNGRLDYPLLSGVLGLGACGQVAIVPDIIKFDIGISESESLQFFRGMLRHEEVVRSVDVFKLLHLIPQGAKVVIYGIGNAGKKLADVILSTGRCELLCMTAQNYQSKYIEGVTICSIDTALQEYAYDYVVIGILPRDTIQEVWDMLIDRRVDPNRIITYYGDEMRNS